MRRPTKTESVLKALLQAESNLLRWQMVRQSCDRCYQGSPEGELEKLQKGRDAQDAYMTAHIENLRTILAELEGQG